MTIVSQRPLNYTELNSRQQESRNFLKVASALDKYGYEVLRTHNDYNGADLIATHMDGTMFQVQLKSRPVIAKAYAGKGLKVAYIEGDDVVIYDHDEVLAATTERGTAINSAHWESKGHWHWSTRPEWLAQYMQVL